MKKKIIYIYIYIYDILDKKFDILFYSIHVFFIYNDM